MKEATHTIGHRSKLRCSQRPNRKVRPTGARNHISKPGLIVGGMDSAPD